MSYINPAPGTAGQVTLVLTDSTGTLTGNLAVPALQNMTINNSNDTFTWSQLDSGSKYQIATTATNSVACNIVVDESSFFGTGGNTTVASAGILGLSKAKTKVGFTINFGEGRTVAGSGYITGLAPTVSADQPVWVSPLTIAVVGDYTLGGN